MLKMQAARTRVGNSALAAGLLAAIWLLSGGVPPLAASSSEQSLRTRVEQLYGALQQGNWGQVEKYLTKESRPIFRYQEKKPVAGYQIESIKLDPSGNTAAVVVMVPTILPIAPQPILKAQKSRWRRLRGVWYCEFSKPDPQALQSAFTTPSHPQAPPPHLRLGSQDLKFQSFWVSLGETYGSEVKVARFPFTNVSNHNVSLAEVQISCDCLRLKTQQKEFKPGEAGVLEFEFDPSSLQSDRVQALTLGVMVTTQPENAVTKLTMGTSLVPGSEKPAEP